MERATLIRDMPRSERPRERLMTHGARALSDTELIALLLRSGRRGSSALDLGREVAARCGGLAGLVGIEPEALLRAGLGPAKAASLLAAVELGVRLSRAELPERPCLERPAAAARYLVLRYGVRDQEVMGALYLDRRQRLLTERELYRGTLSRAAAEPRAILKAGLLAGAAGVLLFHTHPSGDPSPSAEDLAFTRRLAEAAEVVGIPLVDHLILGGTERWISLRERGAW
jgi:DNA repair protein RadC